MSVNDREEYEGDLLTQGNALNAAIKHILALIDIARKH